MQPSLKTLSVSLLALLSALKMTLSTSSAHATPPARDLVHKVKSFKTDQELKAWAIPHFKAPDTRDQTDALLAIAKRAGKSKSYILHKTLAEYILREAHHAPHLDVIEEILSSEVDNRVLAHLTRFVLSQLNRETPEVRRLRAAAKTSDFDERLRLLRKSRESLDGEDMSEFNRRVERALSPQLPDGYEIIKPLIGVGKTGEVALVKRTADGKRFAWKIPTHDGKEIKEEMDYEVKDAVSWKKHGLCTIEIFFAPDKQSIFKEFIDGPTLTQVLTETPNLFSSTSDARLIGLRRLLTDSVKKGVFSEALNGDNLMWDGVRWQVIDGDGVDTDLTPAEALRRYQDSLPEGWSRFELAPLRPKIEKFLESIANDL